MPILIRPSRRFPVCCPLIYHWGDFEGHGTIWNLPYISWRAIRRTNQEAVTGATFVR